ncbi:TetR/AcrR family transcriptional regulator [Streptomyces sp. NPDC096311]|uniref:TetR/AcrR family transcriptional regulator n=1 Tax=Streptomyces sp. NPDC096311 TaxID=3366083 RepID=UPI003806CF49
MSTGVPGAARPLRADAVRNAEKLVRAAREAFTEEGPDALLEDIARRAGVGLSTLYRHFPDKTALIRAVLSQHYAENLAPVVEQALGDENPRRGLASAVEAAVSSAAHEYNLIAAAKVSSAVTVEMSARYFDALAPLIERGQQAGLIRDDVVLDDIRRMLVMLVGMLWTVDSKGEDWRRYVVLMLDALSPEGASPLPPATPMAFDAFHEPRV